MFTTTLFKEGVRRTSAAWRHIAFVPDQELHSKKAEKERATRASKGGMGSHCRSYHRCISVAMKEFRELQQEPFLHNVRIGKYLLRVRIAHLSLLCLVWTVGKAGIAMMMCHYPTHAKGVIRHMPSCMCPFEHLVDTNIDCQIVWEEHLNLTTERALGHIIGPNP